MSHSELLTRKRQLALALETTKGTYLTALDTDSTAKASAQNLLVDPSWTPTALAYERNVRTSSLTPVAMFKPDVASLELSHAFELAGHRDNTTGNFVAPPCAVAMSACGFTSTAVEEWTVATWDTGTVIEHGETFTGDGAGTLVGTFVGQAVNTVDTKVYFTITSGTATTGETLTGDRSGTVITMSGVPSTDTKWAFYPNSDTSDAATAIPTLSGVYYEDGKRIKFKGARGNVDFNFEHANRPLLNFTWTGIIHSIVDGALLTGTNLPPIDHITPPAFLGVGFTMDDITNAAFTPVFNSMSLSMGNSVTLREDSSDADGWSYATITSRAPSLTVNPDEVLEATHSLFDGYKAGTNYYTRFTIGSTLGNIFEFRISAAQIADMSEADRDEVTNWDMKLNLVGGEGPSNQLGTDNELVIICR